MNSWEKFKSVTLGAVGGLVGGATVLLYLWSLADRTPEDKPSEITTGTMDAEESIKTEDDAE